MWKYTVLLCRKGQMVTLQRVGVLVKKVSGFSKRVGVRGDNPDVGVFK
jgi:hypothetical protein